MLFSMGFYKEWWLWWSSISFFKDASNQKQLQLCCKSKPNNIGYKCKANKEMEFVKSEIQMQGSETAHIYKVQTTTFESNSWTSSANLMHDSQHMGSRSVNFSSEKFASSTCKHKDRQAAS